MVQLPGNVWEETLKIFKMFGLVRRGRDELKKIGHPCSMKLFVSLVIHHFVNLQTLTCVPIN